VLGSPVLSASYIAALTKQTTSNYHNHIRIYKQSHRRIGVCNGRKARNVFRTLSGRKHRKMLADFVKFFENSAKSNKSRTVLRKLLATDGVLCQ